MMLKKVVLISVLSLGNGCGGSSGGGGSGNPGINPNGGQGPSDDDANPDVEGFYVVDIIADQNGEKVPTSKLPSMITDGKWFDTCAEGQIFYEDHCYDTVHLSDQQAGFRLESKTKTFVMGPSIEGGWLKNFATKEPYIGLESNWYKHKITWKCGAYTMGCQIPSNIPDGVITTSIGETEYIEELTVLTLFNWGGELPPKSPHVWFMNGTIELKGKVIELPLTLKKLREIYPEHRDGEFIENGYTSMKFDFLSSDLWGVEVEPNPEDRPLRQVRFEVDNNQREEDLQNPDES